MEVEGKSDEDDRGRHYLMRNAKLWATQLLLLVVAGTAVAAQNQQITQRLATLEKLPTKFSFIVFGDNRAGDPSCDAVYRQMIAAALERKPDFIMNTGDQIDKPGNSAHWDRFWELSKNVTMPYFLTVGNHDIHIEVAGSEETYLAQVDLPGKELYYSFTAGNALFIVLDTYIKGEDKRIMGEQLSWLEGILANAMPKHRFVFLHHPLYPEKGKGKHHGNSLDRYSAERDRLHALFRKYNVSMVFSGHEHLYLRKNVEELPYIISGGAGAPLYTDDSNGGYFHYVRVMVDGDQIQAEVLDSKGMVRDRF